ncbi:MAG: hypothetical protein P1P84_11840 [Deferrisomatales bacterium]|nr:hypothetical protein [Deferrisomatales bacterium]
MEVAHPGESAQDVFRLPRCATSGIGGRQGLLAAFYFLLAAGNPVIFDRRKLTISKLLPYQIYKNFIIHDNQKQYKVEQICEYGFMYQ